MAKSIKFEASRVSEVATKASVDIRTVLKVAEGKPVKGKARLDRVMKALAALGLGLALLVGTAHAAPRDAAADAPTARALMADFDAQIAADAVLSSRSGQRLVLSALLCEATELLTSADTHTTSAGRLRLAGQAESARVRLTVLNIEPLACDAWPVARLVQCLGLLPSLACSEDDVLAAQVATAERLAEVRP
jgi:hypothetical protein